MNDTVPRETGSKLPNGELHTVTNPPRSLLFLFAALVAICVGVVESNTQERTAPAFISKVLSASRSSVQFDTGGQTAAAGSTFLMCSTAALTIDRNFKFFRMENRRTEGHGKGSFEVQFFQKPPDGAEVVGLGSETPPRPTGNPETRLFDAVSANAACKKLGFGRDQVR